MRRVATVLLLAVGLPALVVFGMGAGDSGSGYEVRAVFDNASYIVKGEDVKIAGAVVGRVKSLDVTPDKRAAIVLEIDKPGFTPFREGARCTIRPQSLIGEKFVACTPGPASGRELPKIEKGAGKGQHLLPVQSTSSPVDIDLVNDTLRLPFRQRLGLIINEFGTALAGRGHELNQAIHRANPALRETDKVLAVLADQNRTLANLAQESDQALGPLADRRKRVSGFINNANRTAQATAERRADIERNFQRLPAYLRELRPTLADLEQVSTQFTPVLHDLHTASPDLARFIGELGPFSNASIPALASLGKAADVGRPALERSRPLLRNLSAFATDAGPVSKNLDDLTANLDKSGGIERVMDYIFFQTTAINGFDGISHYLRAGLITNLCSSYAIDPVPGCSAGFGTTKVVPPGGSAAAKSDSTLVALRQALGNGLKRLIGGKPSAPTATATSNAGDAAKADRARRLLNDPRIAQQRQAGIDAIRGGAQSGKSPAFGSGAPSPEEQALDYLLGNDR
jgi:ABC-type transporter Mla subunit MlaD